MKQGIKMMKKTCTKYKKREAKSMQKSKVSHEKENSTLTRLCMKLQSATILVTFGRLSPTNATRR
jgi:hypothetical protein